MWDLVKSWDDTAIAERQGLDENKFFDFRIVPAPMAHVTKLEGPAGQEGVFLEGVGDLCRLAASDIYLLPFSHSVLQL